MKKLILLLSAQAAFRPLCAVLILGACASLARPQTTGSWEVGSTPVPTSPTNICSDYLIGAPACAPSGGTDTLHLLQATFVNTNTSGSVTVTVTDGSTNCGGSACVLFSAAITGQTGGTTYNVPFNGTRANRGVFWSATGTGVHGWLKGN
jgi:hypothetical protein